VVGQERAHVARYHLVRHRLALRQVDASTQRHRAHQRPGREAHPDGRPAQPHAVDEPRDRGAEPRSIAARDSLDGCRAPAAASHPEQRFDRDWARVFIGMIAHADGRATGPRRQ
jgi:hypothetical protein